MRAARGPAVPAGCPRPCARRPPTATRHGGEYGLATPPHQGTPKTGPISFWVMANSSKSALVVVDMLNTYEHDDAEALTKSVERVVEPIAALVARARDEGVELIYVNDNYGDWNSSQEELAERAMRGERPDLIEPVLPPDGASFVIKA